MRPFRFYLGTHMPAWLGQAGVPLFVSRRRLAARCKSTLPKAIAPWALDSGGFSELSMYGTWRTDAYTYAEEAKRYMREVGMMDFAAVQDWMCEPEVLAKTGLEIRDHQRMTVESYLTLRELAPEVPWCPVLQGWTIPDYHRHVMMYWVYGVDLRQLPVVGVGSVCRRQGTNWAHDLMTYVALDWGIENAHFFGVKAGGLVDECWLWEPRLGSSDSLAWSAEARRSGPLAGCTHANCANCLRYALLWRQRLLRSMCRNPSPLWDGELRPGHFLHRAAVEC